jgi:hypothetical protein
LSENLEGVEPENDSVEPVEPIKPTLSKKRKFESKPIEPDKPTNNSGFTRKVEIN